VSARVVLAVAALVLAGPLPAAASPTSPEPVSLPGVAQTINGGSGGCLKPSTADSTRVPWPQTFLRPETSWPLTRGAGVTVAVVGSGVDGASGAFGGRLALGPRLHGSGGAGRDCVGHGTFAAGLIAAGRRPGAGFAGIAPEAGILAVAVTDDTGVTTPDLLGRGIEAAADAGARVIDIAVPVPAGSRTLAAAVSHATGRGALVVAPTAPDGGPGDATGPFYPAAYPEVLSVSDLGPGGTPPEHASAGRIDLTAPGDAVMSVGPGGTGDFTATGPSYAAAIVAGTAALALGYRPGLTVAALRDRLETTAYHPGTAMPDAVFGYGTVDPVAAVSAVLPGESGATTLVHHGPPAARGAPMMPAARPRRHGTQAFGVAGGAAAIVLLVGFAAVVLPRGRARGWRPGVRSPAGPPDVSA
jgi:membrane-anchored mycosin MYCP